MARLLVYRQPDVLPRVALYTAQLRALPRRVRRALQRQWRVPLVGIALVLALGQLPALAATIPVSNTCTLVDAIRAANSDRARGGCPPGSGADTIVLPPGSTQTLTKVHNTTYGPTGLPVIRSVVTIAGQGSKIRRAPDAPEFRLFAVASTGELTLEETTVSGGIAPFTRNFFPDFRRYNGGGVANYGGTLTVRQSTISGNTTTGFCDEYLGCYRGDGGGVWNSRGTVTITHSTLAGNTAASYAAGGGGGLANAGGTVTITSSILAGNTAGSGGGIMVMNTSGTVTVTHSILAGNTAGSGGGIMVTNAGGGEAHPGGGTVTVTHSTLTGNTAGYAGGGVANNGGGTVTVTHSTLTGNFAHRGGGVENTCGTATVTHSTLTDNFASYGGGVANGCGTVTVTNSTLTGNTAGINGGGIHNTGAGIHSLFSNGTGTVTNSTLTGNTAHGSGGGVYNSGGTLTLARTLVAGNTASAGPEIRNFGATVHTNHYNLFGVDGRAGVQGFRPGATDVVPGAGVLLPDILDSTLADHGGATQTLALVPGSPAVDAIPPTDPGCRGADQRGVPRPQGAGCDIGAFERGPAVTCGGQIATIVGTAGDDVLLGTPGDDVIHGMGGNDHIDGLGGNDIICGGAGADRLRGGGGDDTLRGGLGADRLDGGAGNDTLLGGDDTDVCAGGDGTDTVGDDCEMPQEE